MKHKPIKKLPVLITLVVITGCCFLQVLVPLLFPSFTAFQRLEWMTYDWRVKESFKYNHAIAPNLAAVFIDDTDLGMVNEDETLGKFSWPWPREVYGKIVRELNAEHVRGIGFDILFKELDNSSGTNFSGPASDQFFAQQLRSASNVVLAAMGETTNDISVVIPPNPFFRTNAFAMGHIISNPDPDGYLRRAVAFTTDPNMGRVWHMGIILAAQALGVDLSKDAVIEPGRIVLHCANGTQRVIPVDRNNFFQINWTIPWNDVRLTQIPAALLLYLDSARQTGDSNAVAEVIKAFHDGGKTNIIDDHPFRSKLVVIGSIGQGNNITDRGPTSLGENTFLVSKHWNVANSILTGEFITPSSTLVNVSLIVLLSCLAAFVAWELRMAAATFWVLVLTVSYTLVALILFIRFRYWIPLVMPAGGSLIMTHICLVSYRVVFEQREKSRVKSVFSKIVSPNVVNELLSSETLSLGGARKRITVYFADVRGFTEMTDVTQAKGEEYIRDHNLTGAAAEAYANKVAAETLETVNTYLATIADKVKLHLGTLDKYIGDCVMAFWGAPTPNEQHALFAVRSAIDAQRAMHELNQRRSVENARRAEENKTLAAANQELLPVLPLLALGTGINTGVAIVGLMGSDAHILNYTVFGREVNLASRLEGVSGRGRIIIGEATFLDLQRDDPVLAATCIELDPVKVKGIHNAVKNYEVPWRQGLADLATADQKPTSDDTMTLVKS